MIGIQRSSDPVVLPDGEHDVGVRSLSSAHDLGQQLIADSEVGLCGDIGQDPRVSSCVEGSACSHLAFASRAQDECRHKHRRKGHCNERKAADREAVDHSEECRDVRRSEQCCCANSMAGFGEERDAAVGVGDSLVGAEQSQSGREWVLVEPSGMEPRSVREAERFTRWRGRSG